MVQRSGLQKINQVPDLIICGLKCGPTCQKQLRKKEKHQLAIEKPKLDNSRKLRGIYFIDPDDGELKETIQNARKKLEIPMEAAMPLKLRTKKRPNKSRETDDETKGSNKLRKTKHACIVEADDSTRKRLESTLPKDDEDHIAEKGFNSLSHHNLVHKFVPVPQAVKIPDAKGAVDKEQRMGKARKVASVAIDQSKEEKEVVLKVHFASDEALKG